MVARIGRKKPLRYRRLYLKEHREAAGLSQEQLAERMDTTKATISRIENGKRDYTGGFLEAAAKALGRADASVFYRPPEQAAIIERLFSAPENERDRGLIMLDALLKTGTGKNH
jgi:transcriptional regulator with XRE-family HTH domain